MASNSSERPPTVWYMDNRLSPVHPMFNNAPVHYDAALQQYVPNGGTVATASAVTNLLSISQPPPPRPEWTTLRAMRFWDAMFSDAMARFRSTVDVSKGRPRQYNIHEATMASKMAPDDPFSTPVLGAVGILLDAANQAAAVRKQVIETFDGEGFENLIPIFSDVELFLGRCSAKTQTFTTPRSSSPLPHSRQSTALLVSILATNLTTLLCTVFRGGKAIMMRGEYEKELVESLKDINTKSEKLLREASKSHMHEAHLYSEQGRRLMGTIQTTVVHGFNHFGSLLTEHTRRMDILIEQNRESHAAIRYLLVENERLRSTSPGLPSPWHPPALPATAFVHAPLALPAPAPYVTQEELQTKLGMSETGLDDILFIFDKKSDFPSRQRLQTEQIIQHQLFADWVVSASSSKILVQWEPPLPRTIADLSPLSLFCANLVQVLGAHDRFISIQWFCGRHLRGSGNGNAMLVSLIAQLLRVHHGGFDMQALSHAFDIPALLESRDTDGLIGLLEWLVRALPQTVTLFCLIDGVILYERPEHWASAEPVLLCLLQLANGSAAGATVKVLFTSTPGPPTVRAAFEEEGLIINVETLPHLAVAPSDVRFARELGQELGN
ncbi:hypothetical protein PG991_014779 [Apiospora marii]|uniref:Fungal STAND N-terminal Goodbye domain-containing protein n=1 Tax=Apiospora marii TaxID=335849 RepID=A0ABR1R4I5_9PEZI